MAAHIQPDIRQRLSSWKQVAQPPQPSPDHIGKGEIPEEQVRARQQRIGRMCLQAVREHDPFFGALKAYVQQGQRDPEHQRRVEDFAAFILKVYEQSSSMILQRGVQQVLDDLPREVIQTVYVEPPPRKSWFQWLLGR